MKEGTRIVWDKQRDEPLERYEGGSLVKRYRKQTDDGLEGMTVKQLQSYAQEQGIELAGASRKADIIAVIEAAEQNQEGDDDGEGGEGSSGGDTSGEDT